MTQGGLRLSEGQVDELVGARRRLLASLLTVQGRRKDAILAMGMALLQQAPAQVRAATHTQHLARLSSLQRHRIA